MPSPASLRQLGLLAYQSGDYKTASGYFNSLLELNSEDSEALFYRGMAGLHGLGADWWGALSRIMESDRAGK